MRHSRIAALLEQPKNDSREALKNNEKKTSIDNSTSRI